MLRTEILQLVVGILFAFCPLVSGNPTWAAHSGRPPQVEVLKTVDEGAGTGFELHRVTIRGTARDNQGRPVADAEIFVASDTDRRPSEFERLRGRTATDAQGRFTLEDVQLLVLRQRPNPVPQPVEGGFVVFGTAENHGFTWHETRAYRPYKRPDGIDPGDADKATTDKACHENEPITIDLTFEPAAKLRGRIADDSGRPLAKVKVQIGLIDNVRNPDGYGVRSCSYLGPPSDPDAKPVSFGAIDRLPASLRETTTDDDGRYEFRHLRRDCRYLTLINPGPIYDVDSFRIETSYRGSTQPRVQSVGYDGVLDWEFVAPREVTVRARYEGRDGPAEGVTVTAHHARNYRRAGARARTDSVGVARLRLPPGDYTLAVEPPLDAPYLYLEQSISVDAEAEVHDMDVVLEPAAVVKLLVDDAETGEPIPGAQIAYETETSSAQIPLSSTTVVADYLSTGKDGRLRAFVAPGKKRFVVVPPRRGVPIAKAGRSELVDLTAGQAAQVRITSASFVRNLPGVQNKDRVYPREVVDVWLRQLEIRQHVRVRLNIRSMLGSRPTIDAVPAAEAILMDDAFRALDPRRMPDIAQFLGERFGYEVQFGAMRLTIDGVRCKEDRYKTDPQQSPADTDPFEQGENWYTVLFNGHEGMS